MKETRDLAKLFRYVISLLLLVIVVITIVQVFFRYVMNSPLVWSGELSRFLLVWTVIIGAAVVSYDERHFSVTALTEKLSPKWQFYQFLLIQVLINIFLVVTIISSIDLVIVSEGMATGALAIPFSFFRVAAPVGCFLIVCFNIIKIWENFKLHRKGLYPLQKDSVEE